MSSTNINKTKDENIDNMLKKSLISKILKSLFLNYHLPLLIRHFLLMVLYILFLTSEP